MVGWDGIGYPPKEWRPPNCPFDVGLLAEALVFSSEVTLIANRSVFETLLDYCPADVLAELLGIEPLPEISNQYPCTSRPLESVATAGITRTRWVYQFRANRWSAL